MGYGGNHTPCMLCVHLNALLLQRCLCQERGRIKSDNACSMPPATLHGCKTVEVTVVLLSPASCCHAAVSCQQCQCCGHVGSWGYALTRVCSVLFGVTLSVLVCNTVLPWYTSASSIETMKVTFVSAVELINQMHANFYADGAAFVAAFEAQLPSLPLSPSAAEPAGDNTAAPAGLSVSGCSTSGAAAAAAAAASDVAAAAGAASALVASKGFASCPLTVSPAVLQSMIARPLVAVQTSLLMDTVAWQRGVLATPPVSAHCCSLFRSVI